MMLSTGDYGGQGVPAFLHKLWSLVEDEETNDLIVWDPSGKSFHVFDQGRFSKEVLPLYFKHNNIASFIRQLNMYGFRKMTNIDHGGLKIEKDDLEFIHPYFQRGQDHLLEFIKRKVASTQRNDEVRLKQDHVGQILSDVQSLKGKQDDVDNKMESLERENEALWREVASLRTKHHKQQQIVNKLIQFLVTMVGNRGLGVKRRMPLMIEEQHSPPAKISRQDSSLADEISNAPLIEIDPEPPGGNATQSSNSVRIEEMIDPVQIASGLSPQPASNAISQPQTVMIVDPSKPNTNNTYMIKLPPGSTILSKPSVPTTVVPGPTKPEPFIDLPTLGLDSVLPTQDDTTHDPVLTMPSASPAPSVMSASSTPSKTVALTHTAGPSSTISVNDVSDHLGYIDDSLDNLKELLAGGASPTEDKLPFPHPGLRLDFDTLLGLFTPDGPIPPTPEGLLNLADDQAPDFSKSTGGELMEYRAPDDFGLSFDTDNFLGDSASYLDEPGLSNVSDDLHTPINFDIASPLAVRRKTKSRTISEESID